jgi:hypothetical protein
MKESKNAEIWIVTRFIAHQRTTLCACLFKENMEPRRTEKLNWHFISLLATAMYQER